jgi:hypothetical protein
MGENHMPDLPPWSPCSIALDAELLTWALREWARVQAICGWGAALGFSWSVGCHPGVGVGKWQLGRVDAATN